MHEGRQPGGSIQRFRHRAAAEAARYGGDAWVFLRELVQNARDADASRVDVTVARVDGVDRVVVCDDGVGMSLDHARRFLFRLYASSKGGEDVAGRFGVGFWSVLRFLPARIEVRSSPSSGSGSWGRRLSGDLEEVGELRCTLPRGTEVVLERPMGGEDVQRAAAAALARDVRYVRRRDGKPLTVRLNGRVQTGPLQLPPPSLHFIARGVRGAVGLGPQPRVELYLHGLRVRTAATLDDLLAGGGSARDAAMTGPDGVFPRLILDSDRLRPLLARSDARDDRELRRVVRRARRELDRLVREQLDRVARRGALRRAVDRVGLAGRGRWWAALVGVVLAAAVLWGLAGSTREEQPPATDGREPRPYGDLAASYSGPAVDVLAGAAEAVDLVYSPPERRPLLAAAHVVGFGADGRPRMASPAGAPPAGRPCAEECLELELLVHAPAGVLRLPVATGHLLDAGSVRVEGTADIRVLGPAHRPGLALEEPLRGMVRYRTGPGVSEGVRPGAWPPVPGPHIPADAAPAQAVAVAVPWVRQRVAYDRSAEVARRLAAAWRVGGDPVQAALQTGAGDCDVQNAVLAAILDQAGVPARLAVGFVGVEGRVLPALHAWVEYLDRGARWRVADASALPSAASLDQLPAGGLGPGAGALRTDGSGVAATAPRRGALHAAGSAALLLAVAGAGVVGWWLLVRTRRRVFTDRRVDVAELLRGALEHPESYAAATSLRSWPLVPVLGGSLLSVRRLASLAAAGRLYVASERGELATRVGRRRVVLDGSRPAGRVVAEALAAVDLDRWQRRLDQGSAAAWSEPVESVLGRWRSGWVVRLAPDPGPAVEVLEVGAVGLRVALVDPSGAVAGRAAAVSESLGAMVVAEAVVRAVEDRPGLRRRALRVVAGSALDLAGGRS